MCKHLTLLTRLDAFQRQQENQRLGALCKIKTCRQESEKERGKEILFQTLIFSLEGFIFFFMGKGVRWRGGEEPKDGANTDKVPPTASILRISVVGTQRYIWSHIFDFGGI